MSWKNRWHHHIYTVLFLRFIRVVSPVGFDVVAFSLTSAKPLKCEAKPHNLFPHHYALILDRNRDRRCSFSHRALSVATELDNPRSNGASLISHCIFIFFACEPLARRKSCSLFVPFSCWLLQPRPFLDRQRSVLVRRRSSRPKQPRQASKVELRENSALLVKMSAPWWATPTFLLRFTRVSCRDKPWWIFSTMPRKMVSLFPKDPRCVYTHLF